MGVLDPRVVVLLTVCAVIVCKTLENPSELGLFFLALAALALASKTSLKSLYLRSLIVMPFTLAAVPLLFTVKGSTLFQLWGFTASSTGLAKFLLVATHGLLCYQALLLGTALTGPFRFIEGMGQLGLPKRIVEILTLALRYLDLLLEEGQRMRRARCLRSGQRGQGLVQQAQIIGQMIGSLFLRALDRAERVQIAMACRGSGRLPKRETRSLNPVEGVLVLSAMTTAVWSVLRHA
jgi:cobalt/nickel transport system permease protein